MATIKTMLSRKSAKLSSAKWTDQGIKNKVLWKCIAFPLVLTLIAALVKLWAYPGHSGIPYLVFFAIFILSAIYGGALAGLVSAFLTFMVSIAYILMAGYAGADLNQLMLQSLLFLLEVLFLTGLIYCLEHIKKGSEDHFSSLQRRTDELLLRKKNHEDFVQVAAHELKSPVTVLKAYTQLISSKLAREGRREDLKFLHKMDLQLEKLQHRITDLMDVAKANAGTLDYKMNDFCINTCLKDCIQDVNAAQPDFQIETSLEPSFPLVHGDQDRIGQVIINLMGNAIKYVNLEKYIRVSSRIAENEVLIEIEDHGIGIPQDMQRHVFERFFRVSNHTTKDLPGSGLGLFISAEIVRKHSGQIGLYSEEGKGAVFWFSLPIKAA